MEQPGAESSRERLCVAAIVVGVALFIFGLARYLKQGGSYQ